MLRLLDTQRPDQLLLKDAEILAATTTMQRCLVDRATTPSRNGVGWYASVRRSISLPTLVCAQGSCAFATLAGEPKGGVRVEGDVLRDLIRTMVYDGWTHIHAEQVLGRHVGHDVPGVLARRGVLERGDAEAMGTWDQRGGF